MSSAPVIQEQESVTFFSFGPGPNIDRPFEPWSLMLTIGGERARDGSGKVYALPCKVVRFSKQGVYHTADPEVIKELRKYSTKPGSGITEDYEFFLEKTLPSERLSQRLKKQVEELAADRNRMREQMQKDIAVAKGK